MMRGCMPGERALRLQSQTSTAGKAFHGSTVQVHSSDPSHNLLRRSWRRPMGRKPMFAPGKVDPDAAGNSALAILTAGKSIHSNDQDAFRSPRAEVQAVASVGQSVMQALQVL